MDEKQFRFMIAQMRLQLRMNQRIIGFITISPPQKVKFNNCPKECPMFRSDKGCISTVCILRGSYYKLTMTAPPVKEKETPQGE